MAFIDRVKYDGEKGWIIYKYPSESIVLGSQLIVNQSQEAVFIKGGIAYDVFGAGTHTLTTSNIPLLSKIINIPFGDKTPFTAEIYYINKTSKLDLKWGTASPFSITDPKYEVITKVKSYGQFGIKVDDSRNFLIQLIGTLSEGAVTEYSQILNYFRGLIINRVKNSIADSVVKEKISLLDITAYLEILSEKIKTKITDEFDRFGVDVLNFYIESINVDENDITKLKSTLNDKAEFEILGDQRYVTKRTLDVLGQAASNEGSGAVGSGVGLGVGIGAGIPLANSMFNLSNQLNSDNQICIKEELLKCPKCGTSNKTVSKFCCECGEKLVIAKKNCPNCKFENETNMKFCGNCGTDLREIKCSNCEFVNSVETKFCGNCGKKLQEDD